MNYGLFYINYNSITNANDNIGCRTLLCVWLTILQFTAQVTAHPLVKISYLGAG